MLFTTILILACAKWRALSLYHKNMSTFMATTTIMSFRNFYYVLFFYGAIPFGRLRFFNSFTYLSTLVNVTVPYKMEDATGETEWAPLCCCISTSSLLTLEFNFYHCAHVYALNQTMVADQLKYLVKYSYFLQTSR